MSYSYCSAIYGHRNIRIEHKCLVQARSVKLLLGNWEHDQVIIGTTLVIGDLVTDSMMYVRRRKLVTLIYSCSMRLRDCVCHDQLSMRPQNYVLRFPEIASAPLSHYSFPIFLYPWLIFTYAIYSLNLFHLDNFIF